MIVEFLTNNWIVIVLVALFIWQLKDLKAFLREAIAGADNKVSYKELTGTIAIFALIVMLVKHITNADYIPNESLLYMFSALIFSLAGIDLGKDYLNKKDNNKK